MSKAEDYTQARQGALAPGERLTVHDHRRDVAGMRYVYAVLSRRAGGVSVGINLNPNNACNWACIYCQVPDLVRGGPPPIELDRLRDELDQLLAAVLHGGYLQEHVPESHRRLADIAFSGNGEPTTAAEFSTAVDLVLAAVERQLGQGALPVRVITNGTQAHRPGVLDGFRKLAKAGGEVWFKLDRASETACQLVNGVPVSLRGVRLRLENTLATCPTWLQTCWFELDGCPPSRDEQAAYLDLVADFATRFGNQLRGVHLYGLARPSMQPGATRISRASPETIHALAAQIRRLGLEVTENP